MSVTLIYAHRGANREAMENTRSAFDKALDHAIDGIETDVQLTRDNKTVLWHDEFLDKIGLPDKSVGGCDLAQLQAMDFAAHFPQDGGPEGIMGLQEFVAAYRKRCRLLLEIKCHESEPLTRRERTVRATLELAGQANGDAVLVSSFDLASMEYAHRHTPGFPLVYNFEPNQTVRDAQRVLAAQPFLRGLCLPIDTLGREMVGLLRDHGKCIAVYTCNSDADICKALELGVDILISDIPQKAIDLRHG